jgi:hypothetical protein
VRRNWRLFCVRPSRQVANLDAFGGQSRHRPSRRKCRKWPITSFQPDHLLYCTT